MADARQTLLAHHWFFQPRGGERVLAELAALLPKSLILTAFATADVTGWPAEIARLKPGVRPSRLQPLFRLAEQVPALLPLLLPLLPWGMRRSFGRLLQQADRLVISDAGLAKTLTLETPAETFCYLHSPMRHIWHEQEQTLARLPGPLRGLAADLLRQLCEVDRQAAARVSHWAVNSETTATRAAAVYGLPREHFRVIHPPVSLPAEPAADEPRRGLLVVSGMEPYKNDQLAVTTAKQLGLPLTVVGDGPLRATLQALAGPDCRFLGRVTDSVRDRLYRSHELLLFCGVEDFGIVPVEAMARGCPVVALAAGGATETITAGETGVLFAEPTVDCLAAAIDTARRSDWQPAVMLRRAEQFSQQRFRAEAGDWLAADRPANPTDKPELPEQSARRS